MAFFIKFVRVRSWREKHAREALVPRRASALRQHKDPYWIADITAVGVLRQAEGHHGPAAGYSGRLSGRRSHFAAMGDHMILPLYGQPRTPPDFRRKRPARSSESVRLTPAPNVTQRIRACKN